MKPSDAPGEFEQIVLLAILRLADAAYGVSISNEIRACAGRATSTGALYTTLERLERKGWLAAKWGEATPERGGRAKRFYQVTENGRTQLVAAQHAYRNLMNGLDLLGESNG